MIHSRLEGQAANYYDSTRLLQIVKSDIAMWFYQYIFYIIILFLKVKEWQPQWGTADAEIKNPPGGSQGLSKVPSF